MVEILVMILQNDLSRYATDSVSNNRIIYFKSQIHTEILLIDVYFRDESVRRAEEMFHQLDNDGNGDLTEVRYVFL